MIFMKHPLLFFAVVLFTFASYAQHDNEYLEKGSIWLEGQVGLNFSNNELARIGEQSYFNQTINNSFRFQLISFATHLQIISLAIHRNSSSYVAAADGVVAFAVHVHLSRL